MNEQTEYTFLIKSKALELGFDACGFSPAKVNPEDYNILEKWLNKGMYAEMQWMEKHAGIRKDPSKLVPEAKTVISVLLNYYTSRMQDDPEVPVISKYAYGRDYHKVVRSRLKKLLNFIKETIPDVKGRVFVDSAPVLEHSFARNAGLGWIGKNSLLISPEHGSYVFLGEVIIDKELKSDAEKVKDLCGNCRLCVDECPTHAIQPGRIVDSNKCISYLTIENPGEIPTEYKNNFYNRVFGCDICQEVCPWNRKAREHSTPDFNPREKLMQMTRTQWQEMDQSEFNSLFEGTPVMRTKFKGLRRNIDFLGE